MAEYTSRLRNYITPYLQLTKPGVTVMVVMTTLAGVYLASPQAIDWLLTLKTVLGTYLVAAGASTLNMYIEGDYDAQMKRTSGRPIPSGQLSPLTVQTIGTVLAIVGILALTFLVNPITGALSALTIVSYIMIYTPLKRRTTLATLIGAVPGALPPVGGWTAVRGEINLEAAVLFAILFFWQIPHFLAIALLYKEDYKRGGFIVLPMIDPENIRTGRQIIGNTLSLLTVSLTPTLLGITGSVYFFGAFFLGIGFLWAGVQVVLQSSPKNARQLLLASVFYLPVLLVLMGADKTVL